jgi:hypothetical protein
LRDNPIGDFFLHEGAHLLRLNHELRVGVGHPQSLKDFHQILRDDFGEGLRLKANELSSISLKQGTNVVLGSEWVQMLAQSFSKS